MSISLIKEKIQKFVEKLMMSNNQEKDWFYLKSDRIKNILNMHPFGKKIQEDNTNNIFIISGGYQK